MVIRVQSFTKRWALGCKKFLPDRAWPVPTYNYHLSGLHFSMFFSLPTITIYKC